MPKSGLGGKAARSILTRTVKQNKVLHDTVAMLKLKLFAERSNSNQDNKIETLCRDNSRLRKENANLQESILRLKKAGKRCREKLAYQKSLVAKSRSTKAETIALLDSLDEFYNLLSVDEKESDAMLENIDAAMQCDSECTICYDNLVSGCMSCCRVHICGSCAETCSKNIHSCPFCRSKGATFIGVS